MVLYPAAPLLPADSCSLPVDENLPGTAATVTRWILLEHPGGWGRDILDGSVFGEQLSAALKARVAEAGARLLLIRQPGRKGQRKDGLRRAFVAETGGPSPTDDRLFTFEVSGAEQLLDLPLEQPGSIPSATVSQKVLTLVCTHSKRDRCCAVRGRPIAAFLDEQLADGSVWECSHTGGHRLAPVGLLLPSGLTYGRLTFESALTAARLAGRKRVSLEGLRGRSGQQPVEQVAEVAVRQLCAGQGEQVGADELVALSSEGQGLAAEVTHGDGRRWLVRAEKVDLPPRPVSCGKGPAAAASWQVLSIDRVDSP